MPILCLPWLLDNCQLKVFALQWIFAFVIAGILTVWSFIALVVGGVREVSDERAPLLVEVQETVTE